MTNEAILPLNLRGWRMSAIQLSLFGKMSPEFSPTGETLSDAFWQHWPAKMRRFSRQGEDGRTLVMCLDPAGQSRGASLMPNISAWPNAAAVSSLSHVLAEEPIPERFFLSSAACAGILRRAAKRGRTLPRLLQEALEREARTITGRRGVAARLSHTLDGANGQAILSFHGSQDPDVSKDVTHPLGRNQGRETCIAIIQAGAVRKNPQSGPQGRGYREDGLAYTLEARAEVQALAVQQNQSGDIRYSDVAYTLGTNTSPSGRNTPMIQIELRVRRLIPLECERLQGFPDHYTRIAWRGKSAENCPDTPRYKALGNSMAVPVMRWIGERIMEAQK